MLKETFTEINTDIETTTLPKKPAITTTDA